MSIYDALLSLFTDDEAQEAYANDPEGYLNDEGLGDISSEDVSAVLPQVLTEIQSNTAFTSQGGFANFGDSGNVVLGGPGGVPAYEGDAGGLQGAIDAINHYTSVVNVTEQSFEDNDTNLFQDNDTIVDNSVDQDIVAFGDVNQEFDNDTALGDESIADGGEGSVNNTGDGAVQNTGVIADSTIATGDVGGSVTGDVTDSVVGDGNQVIDDSIVGAAAFGGGDATNVAAENANLGDGDLINVENSLVSESSLGGGDVSSDDAFVSAGDDSNIAFGEGSSIDTQDTTVLNDDGTVQVAGDGSTQVAATDNSVNDSYNSDDDTYTVDNDTIVDDSFNATDNSVDIQDNDAIDIDDQGGIEIDDQHVADVENTGGLEPADEAPDPGA